MTWNEGERVSNHPDPSAAWERVESAIGYRFLDRQLLIEALTHRSFVNEVSGTATRDNERLEFLGDAVIDLIVSHELMLRHPDFQEGGLSRLRASMVDEAALADLARTVGLGEALRLGRGEEGSGGRDRSSLLADAFEALMAAIYLDGGYEQARAVLRKYLSSEGVEDILRGDPKTALQEKLQAEKRAAPYYRVAAEDGPQHAKTFVVDLVIDDVVVAQGMGRSKKEAERRAASTYLARRDGELSPPVADDE